MLIYQRKLRLFADFCLALAASKTFFYSLPGIKAGIDEFSASPRINQYETGKHEPNYYNVARLAKVLNLPPAYFYADDQQLADLISIFGKLSKPQRKKILDQLK